VIDIGTFIHDWWRGAVEAGRDGWAGVPNSYDKSSERLRDIADGIPPPTGRSVFSDISALTINYASRPARLTRLNDGTYTQQERKLT
jgi:hypothetical protein